MTDELLKLKVDLLERKCDVFNVLLTDMMCGGDELLTDRVCDSLHKALDVIIKCDINVERIDEMLNVIGGGESDGDE